MADATDGLAPRIAALPASLWPMPDATRIAARLVSLLPGPDTRPVAAANLVGQGGGYLLIAAVMAVMLMAAIAARRPAAQEAGAADPAPIAAPTKAIRVPTNG